MKRINTHSFADLDALASTWSLKRFNPEFRDAEVIFRPANWDGAGLDIENEVALDIEAGGKGLKGVLDADGKRHSAFAQLVRSLCNPVQRYALQPLVDFIDAEDVSGSPIREIAPESSPAAQTLLTHVSVKGVLSALREVNRDDAFLLARMSEIFEGMFLSGISRFRAQDETKKAVWFARGKVALLVDGLEESTMGRLFRMGAQIVVYSNASGLGAVRDSKITDLNVATSEVLAVIEAAGEKDDWFIHTAGFIVARGTRKAPAKTPSRVNPRDLAEAVAKLFA